MSAALKLEVFQNGEFLKEVALGDSDVMVGRDQDCVIRLNDRAISRKHGVFRATPQGVEFEKKSVFGNAKINGKDSEYTTLKVGDRLELGPFELRVKQEPKPAVAFASPAPAPAPLTQMTSLEGSDSLESQELPDLGSLEGLPAPDENALQTMQVNPAIETSFEGAGGIEMVNFGAGVDLNAPAEAVEPTEEPSSNTNAFDFAKVESDAATRVFSKAQKAMKAVLEFRDGDANVSSFEITDAEIAIGRSQKCHVVLEDKRSSRKHSLILKKNEKFILKDLGSANGTLVNGVRVDEHELQSGDKIQIGDTDFTFKMLQSDYDVKKDSFIPLTHEPVQAASFTAPQMMSSSPADLGFHSEYHPGPAQAAQATPVPDFETPKEEKKKSFIGKFLDRYRAMNTKQQIIYGVGILAVVWFMLDEDPVEKKAKLNTGSGKPKVAQVKKGDKKPGSGLSFENLTPEQQRYVETEYQLGFDLFKNREYDSSLLEIGKIFSLVQDYKNAREIETFAREGKRKLEAQEAERKRVEQERQIALKLQGLIDQARMLMDKKRFKEAEALFPEIELLQPENVAVSEWRKQMVAENERLEREKAERIKTEEITRTAWADYHKTLDLLKEHKYWDALDEFDSLVERPVGDKTFVPTVKAQMKKVEGWIAAERDPLLVQAKEMEQGGKLSEAYRTFQKAYDIDATSTEASEGMKRIRGTLTARAKATYAEGVFAESYSDLDTAEKHYREVQEIVPDDDDYYLKAEKRLKKLTIFRAPAAAPVTGTPPTTGTPQ